MHEGLSLPRPDGEGCGEGARPFAYHQGRAPFSPPSPAAVGYVRLRPTLIIWDNGIYQITGKQATATSHATDIVAVARGAGISNSEWVRDEAHFEELIGRGFKERGPALLAAKIDDTPGEIQPPRDPALVRNRFMKGLGHERSAVLDV